MVSLQAMTIVGAQSSFVISRTYNNASGGNVTVRAIAMYISAIAGGIMHYLDSVSPDDVIGNGQVYTVTITFQITT